VTERVKRKYKPRKKKTLIDNADELTQPDLAQEAEDADMEAAIQKKLKNRVLLVREQPVLRKREKK
jgi:hypothetical protein